MKRIYGIVMLLMAVCVNTWAQSKAVNRDMNKNQMHLILKGNDIRSYDTDNISEVNFSDNGNIDIDGDVYSGNMSELTFSKALEDGKSGLFANSAGKVEIIDAKGWKESAYVTWKLFDGATSYNIYVKGGQYSDFTKIDDMLVRNYGSYGRADVLGLKAGGNYELKVVPVADGKEMADNANIVTAIAVVNYDRSGFAFQGKTTPGAYNADGTLKARTIVLYVTKNNVDKVTYTAVKGQNSIKSATYTGLQDVLSESSLKNLSVPICVRIIGTITSNEFPQSMWGSSAEGLQIKTTTENGVTLEGVGDDAGIWGFGILCRATRYTELRNFAVMLCKDDCVSLDTDNQYSWVHNLDLFYGNAGSDSDQAKGDGTIDVKAKSSHQTYSYNHLWDSGKASLCGMGSETTDSYIDYHHNWFDHSDSRHPRVRTMSVHVWNNYYDGVSKYGVGSTMGSSVFVENNYYRNSKYPMLISMQGSDIKGGKGTFSNEDGGVIKSFGNIYAEYPAAKASSYRPVTYSDNNTEFDCYEAVTRGEQVPNAVSAKQGGTTYNNFDTNTSIMHDYSALQAVDVPVAVTGFYGAGRMSHGDFKWTFNNAADDASYDVNTALKSALQNYKPELIGVFGEEVSGGGDTPDNPGPDTPDNPGSVVEGAVICNFMNKAPSSDMFTVNGNYSNSKGTATFGGKTYDVCLKIESSTSIKFTAGKKMKMTLVFGDTETGSIKINGVKTAGTGSIITGNVEGSVELTKDKSVNLFLIVLEDISE